MSTLLVAKITLVLGLAWVASLVLKNSSAALRHRVIVIALIASLLIPIIELTLPAWRILPLPGASPALVTPQTTVTVPDAARHQGVVAPTSAARADHGIGASTAGSTLPTLATVWLVGVVLSLGILLARVVAMARRVRRAAPLDTPRWTRHLKTTSARLGIQQPVQLRLAKQETMPAVWGVRRATILLPARARRWTETRCQDVLAHELAHVVRRDVPVLLLSHFVCALYWFHPLAWMLKKRLHLECELAADDLALQQGAPATRYATHLLNTAAEFAAPQSLAPVMAARSHLENRIMAILNARSRKHRSTTGLQISILALAAILLIPLSSLSWAQQETENAFYGSDGAEFASHLEELGIRKSDIDALLVGLTSSNATTRAASAWALGDSSDPRRVDALLQVAYDEDLRVRQWVVRALDETTEPGAAEMLADRLQDSDAEVRQWAARSFAAHGAESRTQPLVLALADEDDEVREWAVRSLGNSDDPNVLAVLADRIAVETNADVSEWIVRSIAPGATASIDAFVAATYNPSAEVRQWAARGLSGKTDAQSVEVLIGMLQDADDEVREWSVRGLGVCGNERAVPALQAMSADSSLDVREWVDRALSSIRC